MYALPTDVGERKIPGVAYLVLGALLLLTSAVATQVFAWRLGFHPELGRPIGHLASPFLRSLYLPWSWARWAVLYGNPLSKLEYPSVVHAALGTLPYTVGVGAVASIVGMVVTAFIVERPSNVRELVDSARWANEKALRAEGFFRHAGPIIGGFETRQGIVPLRYDGQNGIEHIAVPGDDKTTQLKANLLIPLQREKAERAATYGDTAGGRRADFWGEEPSIIALDVKSLVTSTSGYQRDGLGKDVCVFEPLAESNAGRASFNSLWDVRIGTDREADDAFQAALDLVDADGKGLPTYWDNACTAFGAAIIATLGYRALQLNRPELLSLPSLVDYISSHRATLAKPAQSQAKPPRPAEPAKDAIEVLIDDMLRPHDPGNIFGWTDMSGTPTTSRAWIVSAALAMQAKASEERSGVYGSFIEKLGVFRSGILRKHISSATFSFRELSNRPKAAVVYFKIPAMQLNQFRPLVRIFVRAAIRHLTETTSTVDGQEVRGNLRSTLLALDEVATMRRDDELATASGYLRGHGVALMTLWQTPQQKLQHYGEHEALSATMGVHIYGRPEDDKDAEKISRALGQFTSMLTKRNKSHSSTTTTSEHAETPTRSLLTPTEAKRLPRDENIVFSRGLTIRARKFPYWKNVLLERRSRQAEVTASDVICSRPFFVTNLENEVGKDKVTKLHTFVAVAEVQAPQTSEPPGIRVSMPRIEDPRDAFQSGKQQVEDAS